MIEQPRRPYPPHYEEALWAAAFALLALGAAAEGWSFAGVMWTCAAALNVLFMQVAKRMPHARAARSDMWGRGWRGRISIGLVAINLVGLVGDLTEWASATGAHRFNMACQVLACPFFVLALLWPWINKPRPPRQCQTAPAPTPATN